MGLASILIFGEDRDCQISDISGLAGTPARLTKAGFVFLGFVSNAARIA
jgi:hypothetical protein